MCLNFYLTFWVIKRKLAMFSIDYKCVNYANKEIILVETLDCIVELPSTVMKISFPTIATNFSFVWISILNKIFFSGADNNIDTL